MENINTEDINLCDLYAPHHIFSMKKYDEDFSWYAHFHKNNIKGIVYAFYYKMNIIKIGCSYAKYKSRSDKNTSYCERLVRQIKNLPEGTKGERLVPNYGLVYKSENGYTIVEDIQSLEKELNTKIHRNDIYIHVWDITDIESTKYYFDNDDKGNKKKATYFESIVVSQYKRDNNNRLPIGNRKQDPTEWNSSFTKPQISQESGNIILWNA